MSCGLKASFLVSQSMWLLFNALTSLTIEDGSSTTLTLSTVVNVPVLSWLTYMPFVSSRGQRGWIQKPTLSNLLPLATFPFLMLPQTLQVAPAVREQIFKP